MPLLTSIPDNVARVIRLLLFYLIISPGFSQANTTTDTDISQNRPQLTIASTNNFPPINLFDQNGDLSGFARDITDAVMREIGISSRHIHSDSWPEILTWLDSGKADLIHDTGFTPERTKTLDFSLPIVEMPESIFVLEQQYNIHSLADLSGKKVACVNKHITHIYLQQLKQINCHIVNTPAEGLIALINNSVDAFIYPEQIVLYLAQDLNLQAKIKITGEPLRTLSWSMTVKKGNRELLDKLNTGIQKIKASGEYDRIYNHWFGKRILSGFTKKEVTLIVIFASLTILFLAIIIGLWFFSRKVKQSNKALADSELKYRTLAENLPESIFLKDLNSIYLTCNQRFASSIGINPDDITGKSDFDLFPESAADYQQGDKQVIDKEQTISFVEKYTNDDGSTGYINTVKTPVYDDKNKLSGVLGFFWDITEEKKLQEQLSKTVIEYDALTDTVPDIMYRLDLDGNLIWWNKAFAKQTGVTEDQRGKISALSVIAPEHRDHIAQEIDRIYQDGFAEAEALLLTGDTKTPYFFNGACLFDDNNQPIGLVGSGRDISKQKHAEQQQKELQSRLLQAQKMESIGQLTGGIAHDFNNILGVILGYNDLAISRTQNNLKDERLSSYLQEVNAASIRAQELVKQMLTYARIRKSETRSVNIEQFIAELMRMLRPMIPASILIENNIESELPDITFDPTMIQQTLINLFINAKDAIDQQGKITISVKSEQANNFICNACHHHFSGDFISFTIEDNGQGIPEENINKIFEPFMTTKDVGKGTGMGLSMVHGIVHEHDGHIHVESSPGKTIFKLYLPLHLPAAIEASIKDQNPTSVETSSSKGKHILVVDDETGILDMLTIILQDRGYKVTALSDGLKAIAKLQTRPDAYDLVITDQTMPSISGTELSRMLLNINSELPIILCTGYSETVNENTARELGIRQFLRKPVKTTDLIQAIEDAFSN